MAKRYASMDAGGRVQRREFLRLVGTGTVVVGGLVLGIPGAAEEPTAAVETNVADFLAVPRTAHSLPGPFPGRVVQVTDPRSLVDARVNAPVVAAMVARGITTLTGRGLRKSFRLLFSRKDVVGIKVNPVGAPHLASHPEVVDALVDWLTSCGLPRRNIVIWDRFGSMLAEAGFTPQRFPGVRIEGLQHIDESGDAWRDAAGNHVSVGNFDRDWFYLARGVSGHDVTGYKDDDAYLNQHVFNGEYSYFGTLVTRTLTKIINVASFKNTGHAVSMATKNLGYAAICNTARLHAPLSLRVCTEVLAAPVLRDTLVLNVLDGLNGQYDGGPALAEPFLWANHSLYFATDPFALDMEGHRQILAKRRAMGVAVNEHPRFTDYLHDAERLGLGVVDPARTTLLQVRT